MQSQEFFNNEKEHQFVIAPHPPPCSNRTERRTSDNVAAWYIHATPCRPTPRKILYIKSNKQLNCCQTISRVYGLFLALPTLWPTYMKWLQRDEDVLQNLDLNHLHPQVIIQTSWVRWEWMSRWLLFSVWVHFGFLEPKKKPWKTHDFPTIAPDWVKADCHGSILRFWQ